MSQRLLCTIVLTALGITGVTPVFAAPPQVDAKPAAVTHYNAGVVFYHDGRNNAAVEEFRQAIHIDPGFAEAHANLGLVLEGSDMDAAVQQLRQATHLNPELAEAHNTLGAVLYRREQYPAAAAEYRTVLRLHPDSVSGHYNLGLTLAKMKQMDAAISEFQQAVKLKPDFADARLDLGQSLYHTGHQQEARAQWKMAAESSDADAAKAARRMLARHR
jgi:tetratricopeptide (TPR) repeat protein